MMVTYEKLRVPYVFAPQSDNIVGVAMDHEKKIKIDAAEKHSLMFQCIPCYYLVSALPKNATQWVTMAVWSQIWMFHILGSHFMLIVRLLRLSGRQYVLLQPVIN